MKQVWFWLTDLLIYIRYMRYREQVWSNGFSALSLEMWPAEARR